MATRATRRREAKKKTKSRFAKDLDRLANKQVSRIEAPRPVATSAYKPTIKLLYYGDSPKVRTGFGRVAFEVLSRLYMTGKYEIHCLGINDRGEPTDFQGPGIFHYPLPYLKEDPYGQGRLPHLLNDVKPDLIFVLQDIFVLEGFSKNNTKHWFIRTIKQHASNTPWVYYFPIDSRPWKPEWAELAFSADKTIVYSRYAKEVLSELTDQEPVFIPHGVSLSEFGMISSEDRAMTRQSMGVREDQFLIGYISRNQPRKNPAAGIEIFKMANEGYRKCKNCGKVRNLHDPKCEYCDAGNEDAEEIKAPLEGNGVFYPHYNWLDPMGIDIGAIINMNGGVANVLARPNHDIAQGIPQREFNAMINALDCHFLPTMGEGFGLTVIETMRAGVLNIATRSTAVKEQLEDDRGILVNPGSHIIFDDSAYTRKHVIDPESAIHALSWVYEDWKKRKEGERWGPKTTPMIEKAREFCDKHSWDDIAKRFDEEFEDAIKSRVRIVDVFKGRTSREDQNLLFVRQVGHPGDVLQCLLPVAKLKEKYPKSKVAFAVPGSCITTFERLKFNDIVDEWLNVERLNDSPYPNEQPPQITFFDMAAPVMRWDQATYPHNDKSTADILTFHLGLTERSDFSIIGKEMFDLEIGKKLIEKQLNEEAGFTVCLIPESYERRKAWGTALNNWAELCKHAEKMGMKVVTIDSDATFADNIALALNCNLCITVDNAYADFLYALNQPTIMLMSPHYKKCRFPAASSNPIIFVSKDELADRARDPQSIITPSPLMEEIKPGEVFAKIFPIFRKWRKEHEEKDV